MLLLTFNTSKPLFSKNFIRVTELALNSSKPVLGIIALRDFHPFITVIKNRDDTRIYKLYRSLSPSDRRKIQHQIVQAILHVMQK